MKSKFLAAACAAFMAAASPAYAVPQFTPPPLSDLSALTVTAPGGVATALSVWAGQVVNVKLLGAKGDGVTDDTIAFATAVASVNTAAASGVASCLYVPPGHYMINGATLPSFSQNTGGGVCGAGSWKSIIELGAAYVGDLFSWSDTWTSGIYATGNTNVIAPTKVGARVEGVTVIGNTGATHQQNAFIFYDHTDWLYLNDVTTDTLNGRAFYAGVEKYDNSSYIRESVIQNLRIWHSGTATAPAFEIASYCTNATCDASNELRISNVNIFGSAGLGFALRNFETGTGATTSSDIQMARVRVEGNDAVAVNSDLMWIGDNSTTGKLSRISCDECELITTRAGYYALRIGGQALGQVSTVYYNGAIFSSYGNGLKIDAGDHLYFRFRAMTVAGTSVTIASSATVATPILINDPGFERAYSWSVDPTAVGFIFNGSNVIGQPGASATFVAPFVPDGSVAFGNMRGSGAVDWQIVRYSTTQIASGQDSTIGGGAGNAASGQNSVIAGGFGNVASGTNAAVTGSANTASGQNSSVAGGYSNSASGYDADVAGGASNSASGTGAAVGGAPAIVRLEPSRRRQAVNMDRTTAI